MKYIKKFKNEAEFQEFQQSSEFVTPNISRIADKKKNTMRKNVKFKIKDKTYNAGYGMTWDEWSRHPNHDFYSKSEYLTFENKVSNTKHALCVYDEVPKYEEAFNTIIPKQEYDLYNDPDKVIFYTSPHGDIASWSPTSIGSAKIIKHEYINGLGRIVCDQKITTIPSYTFRNTSEFKSIRIPDSVTEIGERAFESCNELTDIYIGKNVRRFNDYAFYQSTKLERVHVSSLENWCSAYFARDIAQPLNYAKQLYVNGKLVTELQIPDGVTSISNYAFYRCESITNIKLPKTVTSIGSNTFRYCLGLTEIDIPDNVTKIGSSCFADCSNIEKIVISNSIEVLESGVFYNCQNLRQLHLGKNVKSIKSQAFTNSPNLQDVYIADINSFVQIDCVDKVNGWSCNPLTYTQNVYINGALTNNIILDDSVNKIGNNIFYGCKWLQSIHLPDTITSIGNYAFYDCTNLSGEIKISSNLTNIGNYAFYGCSGLTGRLIIPQNITNIGDSAFNGCTNLSGELIIEDGVSVIGASSFSGCKNLTSITIPPSVKTIKHSAFANCTGLTQLFINDLIAWCQIDFGHDSGIYNTVYANPISYTKNIYLNNELVTNLVIPSEVTAIKDCTFIECNSLCSVQLPEGVTSIGEKAFRQCVNLAEINFPNTITTIGDYAFYECTKLTELTLPEDLIEVKQDAFCGCSGLTGELCIPNNVETIGRAAFGCCNLTSIIMPTNIKNIAGLPFYSNQNLESISGPYTTSDKRCLIKDGKLIEFAGYGLTEYTLPETITQINEYVSYRNNTLITLILPENLTRICNYAFQNCTKLTSLNIPDNVTTIDYGAFQSCSSLATVNVTSPQPASIGSSVFHYSKTKIYTYDNLVDIYKTKWSNFSTKIYGNGQTLVDTTTITYTSTNEQPITPTECAIISNTYENGVGTLTIIGNIKRMPSFRNASTLQSITIPSSVTMLDNYTFGNCSELREVNFAGNVKSIGYQAFYQCSKLESIIMPDSVETIGSNAFYYCSNLSNIHLSTSLKSIPQSAFYYCSSLSHIEIPDGVEEIGNAAFYYADLSDDLIIPNSVKTIGDSAFWACKFASIKIGDNLNKIGLKAFANCSNLTKVDVTNLITWAQINFVGNSYDGYSANPLLAAHNLYLNGELVTNLSIPDGLEYISDYCFYGCTSITSLELPNSLRRIGNYAFYNCNKITNQLVIPDGVEQIGQYAFANCTGLSGIVVIADSVTKIGGYAFNKCSQLSGFESLLATPDKRCLVVNGTVGGTNSNDILLPMSIGIDDEPIVTYSLETMERTAPVVERSLIAFAPHGITEYVIPDGVTRIHGGAFRDCRTIKKITIPDSVERLETYAFYYCTSLATVIIGSGLKYIDQYAFWSTYMKSLTITAPIAPTANNCFTSQISSNGVLYCPYDESYDAWINGPLANFNWTIEHPYEAHNYYDLSITADNVRTGRQTTTTVYWECLSDGIDLSNRFLTGIKLNGTGKSLEFPQNLSETETVQREVVFEYQGMTAKTTITQGVWVPESYYISLNDNWEKSTTIYNPDEALYDGVYQSFSNKGVNSAAATMYLDIVGYENFKFYIRSYGESGYDYVMVSQLDTDINNNTSYSDTKLVKAHTRNKSTSGTVISNYTLVEFTGMDEGAHRITIVYRKDSSGHNGDDRGYLLIPYGQ